MHRVSYLLTCLCVGAIAAETTPPAPPTPLTVPPPAAAQGDPAVLAPLIADSVAWAAGDRILLVGDLLASPNQAELALRLHDALTAGRPGKDLVVRSLQNHGVTLDQWRTALLAEIAVRPPKVVVLMAGVGDILAAQTAKSTAATAETWRPALIEIMKTAQSAGAAVVLATPTIYGDKPAGGIGAVDLDAYTEVVRTVATETHAELCDLRTPMLAVLTERNGKGTREIGVLSKAPGQLKPDGMDLVAGLLAKSIAAAVPKIPWTVEMSGGPFTGTMQAELKTPRIALDLLNVYYTIDGTEPTEKSRVYTKPFPVSSTTQVKILAVAKTGSAKQTAEAWFLEIRKHAADVVTGETLPGLWVDHYTLKKWRDPIAPLDTMKPDFETWWPNCELDVIGKIPVHRYPNTNYGLRFTGYFLAPLDGVYVFATNSDDASRITIGDVSVLKNDELHAMRQAEGAIELTKGLHSFTLLYAQGPAVYGLQAMVSLPGQRLQLIPDLLFRRPPQKAQRKGISFEPADDSPAEPVKIPDPLVKP